METYKVIRQMVKNGRIRRSVMGVGLTQEKGEALKAKCEKKWAGKGYKFIIFKEYEKN